MEILYNTYHFSFAHSSVLIDSKLHFFADRIFFFYCINSRFRRDEQYGGCAAAAAAVWGSIAARTRTSPTGARPLARMLVARPVLSPATHPSGRPPLKCDDPRGEAGCCGSPCLSPRCAVTLRLNGRRPPFALGSRGRRQGESEEGLNLLKREHHGGSVAMFQIGVERPVLARNVRRTLLHRKDPRCALGNRRGPRPPRPDPFEQR